MDCTENASCLSVSEDEDSLVLFHLTDWQERTSESPRFKNTTYKFRFSVCAQVNGWTITESRTTGNQIHRTYASSLSDLCPYFRLVADASICDGVRMCTESLRDKTQQTYSRRIPDKSSVNDCLVFMREVDEFYKTDFAIYSDVRERIFNSKNEKQ